MQEKTNIAVETPSPGSGIGREISRSATIMLVDDEPTTLDVLEMFLEAAGFKTLVSLTDSRRALDVLAARHPDVLLLNLMMPDIDGFDILRAMRADATLRSIPVIVLTSSTDPEAKRRALELGASDFLAKPVDPSELALRMHNTLAASAARRGFRATERAEGGATARPIAASAIPQPPLVSRLSGEEPRVHAILEAFATRLEEKLGAMEASFEAGDLGALASLAHWLKGTAGTVGFDAFTEPAESLRLLARNQKSGDIGATIRELRQLAERIVIGRRKGAEDAK